MAVSRSCACIGSPCLRHCVHGASLGGKRQVGLGEMCRHIGRSRCWVNAHCAFVNNFTGQVRTASVCRVATGAGGDNGIDHHKI
eukprot:COSAG01_NODE_5543_length_4195_cov_1.542725_2_plen_84_part_00